MASGGLDFGRFRLIGTLANGSMARLYLAFNTGADGFRRTVVLKRIAPYFSGSPEFIRMFRSEARLATQLDHPNIVRIYEFGEIERQHYISMEYVPGEDLTQILRMSQRRGEKIPIKVAASIAQSTADALHFAHSLKSETGALLGLVHRDVSLSNVLVSYHGVAKLTDFGIAKLTGISSEKVTRAGVFKGKYAYASPEHLRGEPLDGRSDVFSLGVVLWEMLTIKRLFRRPNDAAMIHAVQNDEILAPSQIRPDVPPALDAIVLKALARDRNQRFESAAEMSEALEGILAGVSARGAASLVKAWAESLLGKERAELKLAIAQSMGFEEDSEGNLILPPEKASILNIEPPLAPEVALPPKSASFDSEESGAEVYQGPTRLARHEAQGPELRPDEPVAAPQGLLPEGAWSTELHAEATTHHGERNEAATMIEALPDRAHQRVAGWLAGSLLLASLLLVGLGAWVYEGSEATGVAELVVSSRPAGAAISLDGVPTGLITPAKLSRLAPGQSLTVLVEKDGFDSSEKVVSLSDTRNTAEFELERLTVVVVEGAPEHTLVIVDGKTYLPSEDISVRPGEHELRLERDGEVLVSKRVQVTGERYQLIAAPQ